MQVPAMLRLPDPTVHAVRVPFTHIHTNSQTQMKKCENLPSENRRHSSMSPIVGFRWSLKVAMVVWVT